LVTDLGRGFVRFRTRVGESLATLRSPDKPLAEATTPSLEALKAHSDGWQVSFSSGSAASVPFFKRAIEIDPNFASALRGIRPHVWRHRGDCLSAENTKKAYQLRDRASDQEKLFISLTYDLQVTGNLEKAQQTCDLWIQAYPHARFPHALSSGGIYPTLGKYEESVAEAKIAVGLDPDFSIGYSILASSYMALGRTSEAETPSSERPNANWISLISTSSVTYLPSCETTGLERSGKLLSLGKSPVSITGCPTPKGSCLHIPVTSKSPGRCRGWQRI
jgi:tetratricopeptide (TPR) repeat protein